MFLFCHFYVLFIKVSFDIACSLKWLIFKLISRNYPAKEHTMNVNNSLINKVKLTSIACGFTYLAIPKACKNE